MQIRFEMSGGYAGVFAARPLTSVVSLGALPEAERAQVRALVDASGLMGSTPRESTAGALGGDAQTYQLSITADGATRRFIFDDTTVPPAARPLLQHLQQRAIADRAGTR